MVRSHFKHENKSPILTNNLNKLNYECQKTDYQFYAEHCLGWSDVCPGCYKNAQRGIHFKNMRDMKQTELHYLSY